MTFQVFYGTLAVVTPSQYGGEGKGYQTEGQDGLSHYGNLGESIVCQNCSVVKGNIVPLLKEISG